MPNRVMGVPQRSPMGGSGEWGLPRLNASPVGSAGHPSMIRPRMDYNTAMAKTMMGGPMVSRSNSMPARGSMLQQQLMDVGKETSVWLTEICCSIGQYVSVAELLLQCSVACFLFYFREIKWCKPITSVPTRFLKIVFLFCSFSNTRWHGHESFQPSGTSQISFLAWQHAADGARATEQPAEQVRAAFRHVLENLPSK